VFIVVQYDPEVRSYRYPRGVSLEGKRYTSEEGKRDLGLLFVFTIQTTSNQWIHGGIGSKVVAHKYQTIVMIGSL